MDLIIYNGSIHTMDEYNPIASAVGIKDGIIRLVGADCDVLSHKTRNTRIIDARGKCVIPGFNDSHMHLLGYAAAKDGADLTSASSVEDVVRIIKRFIQDNNVPEGALVKARGWNNNMFPDRRFPERLDLDRASTKHLIYAVRVCGHAASVNSVLLNHSGINEHSRCDGGEVLRYADGSLNGVLTENAIDLLKMDKVYSADEIKALIKLAGRDLSRFGITSVQTDDFSGAFPKERVIQAYEALAAEGELTFRVNEQCGGGSLQELEQVLALLKPLNTAMFNLGPIKLFADGSLGARTAYMLEDYCDTPGVRGVPIYTNAELDALVCRIHESGRDAAIHAIGDGAIDMVLASFELAQRKCPRKEARHGIVHAQITTPELLKRFRKLNLLAYVQPVFIRADAPIAAARVGQAKAATSYAWKTLLDSGVPVLFGTDCPVEPFDPFVNIYCAVERGRFNPDQALTVDEAVRAYTLAGAYASYEEGMKGRIAAGQFADIAVLSQDIFSVDYELIPETKVLLTVMNGKVVYEG